MLRAVRKRLHRAQRHSEDVTERVLEQARARQDAAAAVAVSEAAAAGAGTAAGAADERLLALLGADAGALLASWRLTVARRPELAPSEALALAEATLRSLDAEER